MPWKASSLRYVGDARDFWHCIVANSTGCDRPEVGREQRSGNEAHSVHVPAKRVVREDFRPLLTGEEDIAP